MNYFTNHWVRQKYLLKILDGLEMFALRISTKLPIIIGTLTLITALSTGVVAYVTSNEALHNSASRQLEALASARNSELKNYLGSIQEDLILLAANDTVNAAFEAFNNEYVQSSVSEISELRKLYITDNPHPAGEKHKLDAAPDGSEYSNAHRKFHPWLRQFLETRGYYDIFLVNKTGDVIYSVFKENDYATNLTSGEWNNTDLGKVFRMLRDSPKPGTVAFTDFAPYAPSADAPASFIATPFVGTNGGLEGALIFQMPVARINAIMQNSAGMGDSGETYLVGTDHLMRSDSRFLKPTDKSSILNQEVDTATVNAGLAGKTGVALTPDYRGVFVLSAHTPVVFNGVSWALMAEMDDEEVIRPVIAMRNLILMIVTGIIIVMAVVGLFFARSISKPIVSMTEAMGHLAEGDLSIDIPFLEKKDELGLIAGAVQVFKDNSVEISRLREEQEANAANAVVEAQAERERMASNFETTVGGIVEAVASAATEMQASAQALSATSEVTTQQSSVVAAVAEETSNNIQTVSSAAEELSSSIAEINRQVRESAQIAEAAVGNVEATNERVHGLTQASEKIEAVISLITDIAEQTNLLALNATIEAARAGDAGKGFAVVASEVKELASQTAKATEEIGAQIKDIQDSTSDTVSAIQSIGGTIQSIREISGAIATAVEEQGSATQEIARNIEQVASGTVEVTSNIAGVNQAASETGHSSGELLAAANELSQQSEFLNSEVGNFLQKVRAG